MVALTTCVVVNVMPASFSIARSARIGLISAFSGIAAIGLIAAAGALGVTVVILVALTSPLGVREIRPLRQSLVQHISEPTASADEKRPTTHAHSPVNYPQPPANSLVGSGGTPQGSLRCPIPTCALHGESATWPCNAMPSTASLRSSRSAPSYWTNSSIGHPVEFHRWIRAGARAASDPARYLVAGHNRPAENRRLLHRAGSSLQDQGSKGSSISSPRRCLPRRAGS